MEPPVDEKPARSASPNLLDSLPGLRREQKEEPVPIDTQECPDTLLINAESDPPSDDGSSATSHTPTPPSVPLEIPPADDFRPGADPSPLDEPPPQQPCDHHEAVGTSEFLSSPSVTQSVLQVTPQDASMVEPVVEVKQEPGRQLTPPPPVREVSPVPQKVKTSFKDFLMRKKKGQVESPIIPTSTIPLLEPTPTVHAGGPDAIVNPSEAVNEPDAVPSERPSGPPPTEPPDGGLDTSSSPAPEPEPVKADSEVAQPPRIKSDDPPESWLHDSQFLRPGVVVCLREGSVQEWDRGDFVGVPGVADSLVNLPGRPPTASFKPTIGRRRAVVIPVTAIIPARPRWEGEVITILSGQHEGKIGKVVKLTEDIVSVDLDGPETAVVDIELPWVCLFSREGQTFPPSPIPPPPRAWLEKGNSMSPPPAPQSEDGEIPQDPPPRSQSQQPCNPSSPPITAPLRAAPLNAPTQPRSFQSAWKNNTLPTVPSRPNSLSHLLNANPNGSVNSGLSNLSTTFTNSPNRPGPPSGPKALRGLNPRTPFDVSRYKTGMGSGLSGNGMSGPTGVNGNGMGAGLKRDLNPNNGHPAIPKGPSADRERERERGNSSWSTKNWGGGWR